MAIAVAGIASLGTASKALADGHGQRVYNQCRACHVLDAGVNRVGPSLADLNGRTAGTVDGFRYSPALADSGIVWNEETLKAYLTDPRGYIPGNRMAFRGIRKEEDLDALVDYLFGDD
ncbi:MAG: cytochrome c family protein [Inquilinus sp.]|nr:cytochrome c family protein [Inquilinus sp.]